MLDVIGAGATATTDRDWHQVWLDSDGCQRLQADIEDIHSRGRKSPPISATLSTHFATPWAYQLRELLQRQNLVYWRNPTYLMSKLTLNIIGGLFIGFTFFKSKDSIQGNQNKLFVSRLVICGWRVSLNRGVGYFHEHYSGKIIRPWVRACAD